MPAGRIVTLAACLVAAGCNRPGSDPPPPPAPTTTLAPTTTTTARVPKLTADPIPEVTATAIHGDLVEIGFTTADPTTAPGFVTTTSKRPGATVSTYGTGADDVVKVIAEADTKAAPKVLPAVAAAVLKGAEAKRARAWLTTELKKGPKSPTEPRSSSGIYGKQPHALLITTSTATLSIGRLSA